MPKTFKFFKDAGDRRPIFSCPVEQLVCTGRTKQGAQCSRRVLIGTNLCCQHMLKEKQLCIKDSTIPGAGKGLFAMQDKTTPVHANRLQNPILFRKDEKILTFYGEFIDQQELNRRYQLKNAPYVVRLNPHTFVDSACKRGLAALANHTPQSRSNARISRNHHNPLLMADKVIRHGDEITCNYGNGYNMHDGSRHSTR